jgi:hypothetical protein
MCRKKGVCRQTRREFWLWRRTKWPSVEAHRKARSSEETA